MRKWKKFRLVEHNSNEQMNWGDNDDTREHLCIGEVYDAEVDVHRWHTKLIINGKKFNSVCFEEEENSQG